MGFSSFFLVKRDCSLNYQRKFDVPKTNEEKSLRLVNLAKLLLTGFDVENIIRNSVLHNKSRTYKHVKFLIKGSLKYLNLFKFIYKIHFYK